MHHQGARSFKAPGAQRAHPPRILVLYGSLRYILLNKSTVV
jgi:hypothetical protein